MSEAEIDQIIERYIGRDFIDSPAKIKIMLKLAKKSQDERFLPKTGNGYHLREDAIAILERLIELHDD